MEKSKQQWDIIKEREEHRKHPFPVSPSKEEPKVTKELFTSYYTGRFSSDLRNYYNFRNGEDSSYPWVFCNEFENTGRLSMKWEGVGHFYMFSVSVFFMSMCTHRLLADYAAGRRWRTSCGHQGGLC